MISRAVGAEHHPTEAEPEIVRQVVSDLGAEWGGPAVDLTLTGVGGGAWRLSAGESAASVTEDAVAFMRLLSSRSDECALTHDGDRAAADQLRGARVVF